MHYWSLFYTQYPTSPTVNLTKHLQHWQFQRRSGPARNMLFWNWKELWLATRFTSIENPPPITAHKLKILVTHLKATSNICNICSVYKSHLNEGLVQNLVFTRMICAIAQYPPGSLKEIIFWLPLFFIFWGMNTVNIFMSRKNRKCSIFDQPNGKERCWCWCFFAQATRFRDLQDYGSGSHSIILVFGESWYQK